MKKALRVSYPFLLGFLEQPMAPAEIALRLAEGLDEHGAMLDTIATMLGVRVDVEALTDVAEVEWQLRALREEGLVRELPDGRFERVPWSGVPA